MAHEAVPLLVSLAKTFSRASLRVRSLSRILKPRSINQTTDLSSGQAIQPTFLCAANGGNTEMSLFGTSPN